MAISSIVSEKSDELFVMNRSAPADTAVARCTASTARSPYRDLRGEPGRHRAHRS